MNSAYGLEYALFFGVPSNKIELLDGTSRWAFPFLRRAEAEAHFHDWLETLRRWKQVDAPTSIDKSERIYPERRWEFWDNKARSVLAFGSAAEARARLDYFLTEACRWESLPRPKISPMADDVEQTEAGRFQLTRHGRLVFLDVAIDGRRHPEILTRWANRDAWDWGEEE